MIGNLRKRLRDSIEETTNTAASLRSALAVRVESATPRFWHHATAGAGATGTDAFLAHLGQAIEAALKATAESAEAAQEHLRFTRSALHAAVDARCDVLGVSIASAQASKAASLECELVAVDTALGRWQAESAAMREAVSSLSDADLVMQQSTVFSHLDDLEVQLQTLSTAVVEPPYVGLLADAAALLSSIAGFGRVLAPLSITAADLSLEGMPSRVRLGNPLRLHLSLGTRHAAQCAEELEVSLCMLATATHVEATVEGSGVEPQTLQVALVPDAAQRCLLVSFLIKTPCAIPGDPVFRISAMTVTGQPLPGPQFQRPVNSLRGALPTPLLQLHYSPNACTTPCISPEGRLYCPASHGPEVLVFDANGTPLLGLPVASIGLLQGARWAAYVHGDAPFLLLASSSRVVAVNPLTQAVRWTSADGSFAENHGIAVLPTLDAVIVITPGIVFAHRLSDGIRVGSLDVPGLDWFLAADTATGTVYGCVKIAKSVSVCALLCSSNGPSIEIRPEGPSAVAGALPASRPLAVVPPAPGKKVSHLVVGKFKAPELLVLSLPGLVLVHTHRLEGMKVTGLAADPWGGALAVHDVESKALHVLAWPLPGMPPLL